jgi:hypothetical protein
LEANKDTRPEWYDPTRHSKKKDIKNNDKVANTAMNHSGMEVLLSAMACQDKQTLDTLLNHDIWIVDTGATCDISPHIYGAQNIQKDSNNIVFGDRDQHNTSLEFHVCGWISDDQTRAVKMSNVPADPDH